MMWELIGGMCVVWAYLGWQLQGIKRAANMAVSEARSLKGRVEDSHENLRTRALLIMKAIEIEVRARDIDVIKRCLNGLSDWRTKYRVGPKVPDLMWLTCTGHDEGVVTIGAGETVRLVFPVWCDFNLERLFVYGNYIDDGLEVSIRIGAVEVTPRLKYNAYLSAMHEDPQVRILGSARVGIHITAELKNTTHTSFMVGAVCLGHKKPCEQQTEQGWAPFL